MTKLTVTDLERTLQDDRHIGFGYAESQYLPTTKRARLDRIVVEIANELGWDYEDLFVWSNSKYGRWLSDEMQGGERLGREAIRHLIRNYVNAEALRVLKADL